MSQEVVIVGAARTPIGSFLGSLSGVKPQTLGAIAMKEALLRSGLSAKELDEIIVGHIMATEPKGNPGREAALEAGIPIEIPAFTVNKNCASSVKSVTLAAALIKAGEADAMLAAGMENMSAAPYLLKNARKGFRMGEQISNDLLQDLLFGMGMTAERLAKKYNISREEQDAFAMQSQIKAARAQAAGLFDQEIVPVEIKTRKGIQLFSKDEGIKEGTTLETLSKLKPAFLKGGSVTAGNSSTINDAGAAVVLMTAEKAKALGLKPLVRVRGWASAGCDPDIMGIGPVPATQKLMKKTGTKINDFDLIELNEAFAAQSLAVLKELAFDLDRVNVNGGAISLGHPTGATGAILITKLIYSMKQRGAETGLVTLCIGGGQGMSVMLENI